jgi:hypothetical protein
MNTNKVIYESGATSHAVNDLILFTDTTRELAETRDYIYKSFANDKRPFVKDEPLYLELAYKFLLDLLPLSIKAYIKTFPSCSDHISTLSMGEKTEFCDLYALDFETWKAENGYK